MNWKFHIETLQKGETASFRPKGNSMQPRIESGNLVTVSPDTSEIEEGDIVFCKVHGNHYVHLVKGKKVDGDKELFLIGNNKGGINGWVARKGIFGKVTEISS
jgi:phage repressor protein C with HTH and peptisase S24 domain